MEWPDWRKHIDQVVADTGRWVGLCDGWGKPIMQMPPHQSLTATESRFSSGTLDMTVPTVHKGIVSQVVDHMVADGLGVFDENGLLIVKDQIVDMVVDVIPGIRRGYITSYPTVSGTHAPTSLKIQGTDLLDMLYRWPCPSYPLSWIPNHETWEGDVVDYTKPRTLALMDLAVVADGFTMQGPAEATIQTLIQDSFDAVNKQNGWLNTPHMVVDMTPTGNPSETVNIRLENQMLADTVFPIAQMAGVNIKADLWWPGDDPILTRTPDRQNTTLTTWDRAISIIRVEQIGG